MGHVHARRRSPVANRFAAILLVVGLAAAAAPPAAQADALALPLVTGTDLIGAPASVVADAGDTLIDVARRYGLGYEEMVNANPGVDPWLPGAGTPLALPTRRILPAGTRDGLLINLPEHRIYYFPPRAAGKARVVLSYPVSIGKMDWNTPLGLTRVAAKVKDPTWTPPKSVRDEHEKRGDILPEVVPAGPDNPLGQFALRLGIPGGAYMIHGTNRPAGVGMQVTHGCMRLYPEDIEQLFGLVAVNTPVQIVNQPFKLGWDNGELWLEVHPPLEEDAGARPSLNDLMRLIVEATRARVMPIDWEAAQRAWERADGLPVRISSPGM